MRKTAGSSYEGVAATADGWMTAGDDVGCYSVSFDDTKETMYAYGKSRGVQSFDACPAVPDPEAFENDAADLEAAGADRAVILRRARWRSAMRASVSPPPETQATSSSTRRGREACPVCGAGPWS